MLGLREYDYIICVLVVEIRMLSLEMCLEVISNPICELCRIWLRSCSSL